MPALLALMTLIAAAALLAWSSLRASRAKNNFVKWGGRLGSPVVGRRYRSKRDHDCRVV